MCAGGYVDGGGGRGSRQEYRLIEDWFKPIRDGGQKARRQFAGFLGVRKTIEDDQTD